MTYLDTSALIKRFVVEAGSSRVDILLTRHGPAATATLAYAEVHAGLARKKREALVSERGYALTCQQFESEWRGYVRVDLRDDVLTLARDLVRRHPLRGADAIHLASALSFKQASGEDLGFAASDTQLLRAARAERLRAVNVEQ